MPSNVIHKRLCFVYSISFEGGRPSYNVWSYVCVRHLALSTGCQRWHDRFPFPLSSGKKGLQKLGNISFGFFLGLSSRFIFSRIHIRGECQQAWARQSRPGELKDWWCHSGGNYVEHESIQLKYNWGCLILVGFALTSLGEWVDFAFRKLFFHLKGQESSKGCFDTFGWIQRGLSIWYSRSHPQQGTDNRNSEKLTFRNVIGR